MWDSTGRSITSKSNTLSCVCVALKSRQALDRDPHNQLTLANIDSSLRPIVTESHTSPLRRSGPGTIRWLMHHPLEPFICLYIDGVCFRSVRLSDAQGESPRSWESPLLSSYITYSPLMGSIPHKYIHVYSRNRIPSDLQ